MTHVPLVGRPPASILFRGASGILGREAFAAAALALAAALPDVRHVILLDEDREAFALALAATVLRGQVAVLSGDRTPQRLRAVAAAFPSACTLSRSGAVVPGLEHVRAPMPDRQAAAAVPDIRADALAAIVLTSGSTGEPVAHEKRWGELAARSCAIGGGLGLQASAPAVILGAVPPAHMYGFETTVLLPLHAPCESWSDPVAFPGDIVAASASCPTPPLLIATPLLLGALVRAAGAPPRLRGAVSATAPLDRALAEAAEARLQGPVQEIFGATELGSIAVRRTVAGEDWTMLPGLSLRPGAADAGVMELLAPEAAPARLPDQVLPVAGGFRLLGRRSDLVKLGGRRASLAGLNRILAGIDGVQDGVFVAPEEPEHHPGRRLRAVVVAPDRSEAEIMAALRQRLEPAFLPRRVIRVASLPRNDLGKLPLASLAPLLAADPG